MNELSAMVTTVSGGSEAGNACGEAGQALFNQPEGIAVDSHGHIYVSQPLDHCVRSISAAGQVENLVRADLEGGFADGKRGAARMCSPHGIATDGLGNVWVADTGNRCLRRIGADGVVRTLVLREEGGGPYLGSPVGMAVGPDGSLYVTDVADHRVLRVQPDGQIASLAGGRPGYADGCGEQARFKDPQGIALGSDGLLYVADQGNHCVRRISPYGHVTTVAGGRPGYADGSGSAAQFDLPTGIAAAPDGSLYVTDSGNARVRRLDPGGTVTTVAGGHSGYANGPGRDARFARPAGIACDGQGNLYVADAGNNCVRRLRNGATVAVVAGSGEPGLEDGPALQACFRSPQGVVRDRAGHVYVADTGNHAIRVLDGDGRVRTVAGGNGEGLRDSPEPRFRGPTGIAVSDEGLVYVADTGNHCIRLVAPDGTVTTLAGDGTPGLADGPGSSARFRAPAGLALDSRGNLYVADSENHAIRRLAPDGTVTTVAGAGPGHQDGPGRLDPRDWFRRPLQVWRRAFSRDDVARFCFPRDLAADAHGNLYVADSGNHCLRMLDRGGILSTLAGESGEVPEAASYADGKPRQARFWHPRGIAVDAAGRVYVAESRNLRIRMVAPGGSVSTLPGSAGDDREDDPHPCHGKPQQLRGMCLDDQGNLLLADPNHHRIYVLPGALSGREPALPGAGARAQRLERASGREPARPLPSGTGREPARRH